MEKECSDCKQMLPIKDFGTTGRTTAGNKIISTRCKKCFVCRRTRIHNERVDEAVNQLGMEYKCVYCGYDRYRGGLDFHHLDSTEKKNGIGSMRGQSFEKIKTEAAKCIILCKICHIELHAGLINLK